jgi:hypothetical protein
MLRGHSFIGDHHMPLPLWPCCATNTLPGSCHQRIFRSILPISAIPRKSPVSREVKDHIDILFLDRNSVLGGMVAEEILVIGGFVNAGC